ncbi:MAG TPA: hypothetical protein VLS49_13185 [Usitatibacter sp.]|nr:hypothetical protein [Usitatibacter sp.]
MDIVDDWQRAHAELLRIAKERLALDRDEGRWLLVAQRMGVHRRLGFASFVEYVERILGYSPKTTGDKLRVAAALEDLPELAASSLSWSALRELTRVATPVTEKEWIAATAGRSVRGIERMVSGRRPGDRPSDPAGPRRHVLRYEVSAETLATVREAMMKLRRDTDAPIDDDAALLLMARAVLGGPADAGRASYQIALTVCERCRQGTQRGKGEAIPVEPAVVAMAECDAQRVAGGRATQGVPPAARREVMIRDGGRCAVPGCVHATYLDLHHVDPRAEGGTHDPAKMLMLCGAHHRLHHHGRLIVEGDAHVGFTFRHADGSTYGRVASAQQADDAARVFGALRKLGFKEREVRRAIEQVRAHVGEGVEAWIRAALGALPAGGVAPARA